MCCCWLIVLGGLLGCFYGVGDELGCTGEPWVVPEKAIGWLVVWLVGGLVLPTHLVAHLIQTYQYILYYTSVVWSTLSVVAHPGGVQADYPSVIHRGYSTCISLGRTPPRIPILCYGGAMGLGNFLSIPMGCGGAIHCGDIVWHPKPGYVQSSQHVDVGEKRARGGEALVGCSVLNEACGGLLLVAGHNLLCSSQPIHRCW